MRKTPPGQEPKNVRAVIKRHKLEGGRGETYPFDDWATGEWIDLLQGEDFDVTASSMRMTLRRWAQANGGVTFASRVSGPLVQFKLGPLTPDQREHRSAYLTTEEFAKYVEARRSEIRY